MFNFIGWHVLLINRLIRVAIMRFSHSIGVMPGCVRMSSICHNDCHELARCHIYDLITAINWEHFRTIDELCSDLCSFDLRIYVMAQILTLAEHLALRGQKYAARRTATNLYDVDTVDGEVKLDEACLLIVRIFLVFLFVKWVIVATIRVARGFCHRPELKLPRTVHLSIHGQNCSQLH